MNKISIDPKQVRFLLQYHQGLDIPVAKTVEFLLSLIPMSLDEVGRDVGLTTSDLRQLFQGGYAVPDAVRARFVQYLGIDPWSVGRINTHETLRLPDFVLRAHRRTRDQFHELLIQIPEERQQIYLDYLEKVVNDQIRDEVYGCNWLGMLSNFRNKAEKDSAFWKEIVEVATLTQKLRVGVASQYPLPENRGNPPSQGTRPL